MSATISNQHIITVVTQKITNNPEWAIVLAGYLSKMVSGYYSHIDILGQKHFPDISIFDAYAFSNIHTMWLTGQILACDICVADSPLQDKMTEENNAILSDLPSPFIGIFKGGIGDNDGRISWDKPITIGNILHDGTEKNQIIPPGSAPLEVGYTAFETTYMHLASEKRLARWPYGSKVITLLCVVDKSAFEIDNI